MSGPPQLIAVFLAGALAGWLYFCGLLLTVLKARSSRRPGLLLLGSFALRAGLAAGLFAAAGQGQWPRYGACILGFLGARGLAILLWGPRCRRKG